MPDVEGRLTIAVQCSQRHAAPGNSLEFRLNDKPVRAVDLRDALRAEISGRAHRVVYVRGEGCLQVGQVVRVIDIAREGWYGIPVVLLTPEVERTSQQ